MGHVAFRAVRRLTLQYEKGKSKDEIYGGLLYLAENVAKVTYNATNPRDPLTMMRVLGLYPAFATLLTKSTIPNLKRKPGCLRVVLICRRGLEQKGSPTSSRERVPLELWGFR